MAKSSGSKRPPRPSGAVPASGGSDPGATRGPQFAEATPTADPNKFSVKHGSDTKAYTILDREKGTLKPRSFQVVDGADEPVLTLAEALGDKGDSIIVNKTQLRIEYHPASDGADSKTPDDTVTVDLASRKLAHFGST